MVRTLLRRRLLESGAVPTRYLNAVSRILGRHLPVGRNVLEYDWDTCVVLDACRWDLFQEFAPRHDVYPRFETVSSVWSVASCTPGWMPRTFEGRRRRSLEGTVYVVDNGHSDLLGEEPPVELDELWRYGREADSWLVDPELVTERALAHVGRSDVRRVLVHYTVAHAPFRHAYDRYSLGTEGDERRSSTVWDGLEAGAFDEEQVWRDYGRNLLLGLDQVVTLIERTEGRILVTSDHGNSSASRAPTDTLGEPSTRNCGGCRECGRPTGATATTCRRGSRRRTAAPPPSRTTCLRSASVIRRSRRR